MLIDHAWSAIATSDPLMLTVDKDYSSFDASHTKVNVRDPMVEGLNDVFGEYGAPFGPWDNIMHMIKTVLGKGRAYDRWYRSSGNWKNGPKDGLIHYDRLGSGEAITTQTNMVANKALQLAIFDELKKVTLSIHGRAVGWYDVFKMLRLQIMGDDEQETWLLQNKLWTIKTHRALVDTTVAVSSANGYDINPFKSLVRKSFAEYLKKTFAFGYNVPLGHIQMLGRERGGLMSDPIDLMRGYSQLITTASARGFNRNDIAMRILHFTWSMRRGVRFFEKEETGYVYLPFALLWTPIAAGGIGAHWLCPYGANKDAALSVEALLDPELLALMNHAASTVEGWRSNVLQNIEKQIAVDSKNSKSQFSVALNELKRGMPSSRIVNSLKAERMLESEKAPSLGRLAYINYPSQMVGKMFTSNPKMQRLQLSDQLRKTRGLRRSTIVKPIVNTKFAWLYAYDWAVTPIFPLKQTPQWQINPDNRIDLLVKMFGVDQSDAQSRVRASDLLSTLRRDRWWRRDITEEGLFDFLSQNWLALRPDLVIPALIGIGARPDLATKMAAQLGVSLEQTNMKLNVHPSSFNDEFLGSLNTGIVSRSYYVQTPHADTDGIKDVFESVGLMLSILRSYGNTAQKVTITENIDSVAKFRLSAFGYMEDYERDKYESMVDFRWEDDTIIMPSLS